MAEIQSPKGLIIDLITPLDRGGGIDGRGLGKLLDLVMPYSQAILLAGPYMGEGQNLEHGLKEELLEKTLVVVRGHLPILIWISGKTEEETKRILSSLKKIIDKRNMKKNAVFFLEGFMYLATGFLWPLFIFLSSITIMTIGIFYLLSNLLHSLFTILGGRWSDKYGNHTMAKIGCVTWGGSIVLRALQKTSLAMSAMQGLGGVTGAVFTVSLHGLFYRVSHKDPQDSMLNRELYMHIGRISALLITAAVMQFTSIVTAFTFGLIMCGMASLFMVRVVKHLDPVN